MAFKGINDEFKFNRNSNVDSEFNKSISEFKPMPAIPNAVGKEEASLPDEEADAPEDFANVENKRLTRKETERSRKERIKEEKENLDNLNKYKNQDAGRIEETSSSTVNASSASSATSTTAAASTSSSAVVATSTFAGGLTIIAAGAILGVVSADALSKNPLIDSVSIVCGSDFLCYDFDIKDDKNSGYKVRIYKGNEVIFETEITEMGHQRKIVPGLTPFCQYELRVVSDEQLGEQAYLREKVNTSWSTDPKMLINFEPEVDYENGLYNLYYEVYFSDYKKLYSNPYVEFVTKSDDNILSTVTDDTFSDDGFMRGYLTPPNNTTIEAYGYCFNDQDEIDVGNYKYDVVYPSDLEIKKSVSTYSFQADSFSEEIDYDNGYVITLNTGFDNQYDPKEKYRINVYNDNNELITQTEYSDSSTQTVTLPFDIRNVSFELEVSRLDGTNELLLDTKTLDYHIDNPVISGMEFFYSGSGYGIACDVNEELFSNKRLMTSIIIEFKDGTTKNVLVDEDLRETQFLHEAMFDDEDESITIDNVSNINFKIYDDTNVYGLYNLGKVETDITLGEFDVNTDGSISLPYDIDIKDSSYTFDDVFIQYKTGSYEILESSSLAGDLVINELNDNILQGDFEIKVVSRDGVRIRYSALTNEVDLNAQLEIDSYVSYISSNLETHTKFTATIDGQKVNMGIKLENVKKEFEDGEEKLVYDFIYIPAQDSYYAIPGLSYDGYTQYKITSLGFDGITDQEIKIEVDPNIIDSYAGEASTSLNEYSVGNTFSEDSKNSYVKTKNSDGTVNYYFYLELNDTATTGSHSTKLKAHYKDSNDEDRYIYIDTIGNGLYQLLDVPELDYDFSLNLFFNNTDGVTYYIDKEIKFYEENSFDLSETSSENVSTDDTNTYVSFILDTTYVDRDKGVTVTIGDNVYEISFDTTGMALVEIENGYNVEINREEDTYSYMVALKYNDTYSRAIVTLTIPEVLGLETLLKISYQTKSLVLEKFGSSGIKGEVPLYQEVTKGLLSYGGDFDPDKLDILTLDYYHGNEYGYYQTSSYILHSNDRRDMVDIVGYTSDGFECFRNTIEIDSTFYLQYLPEIGDINLVAITYKLIGDQKLIYNTYDLGVLSLEKITSLNEETMVKEISSDGLSFNFDFDILDSQQSDYWSYKAVALVTYKDGTQETLEDVFTSSSASKLTGSKTLTKEIDSIRLYVYRNYSQDILVDVIDF